MSFVSELYPPGYGVVVLNESTIRGSFFDDPAQAVVSGVGVFPDWIHIITNQIGKELLGNILVLDKASVIKGGGGGWLIC